MLHKGFRLFIDDSVLAQDRCYLSAGRRGLHRELAVGEFLRVTGAQPVVLGTLTA